jgi:hypothetical protein
MSGTSRADTGQQCWLLRDAESWLHRRARNALALWRTTIQGKRGSSQGTDGSVRSFFARLWALNVLHPSAKFRKINSGRGG